MFFTAIYAVIFFYLDRKNLKCDCPSFFDTCYFTNFYSLYKSIFMFETLAPIKLMIFSY